MQSNIFSALEQLGLTAQKRAIHIQFSNAALNSQIFLQRIDVEHILNQGLKAELICLSTDATLSLKQFIGAQAAIDQVTDQGTLFRTTGIITQAAQGQSDGSLTLYKLTLEDPTALWHKRRNSRVFMNKSAVDVIQTIFSEWQSKSPLFAASLSLDMGGLSQQYDVRPFIMQSNETDYDFLTRLMRSEGINWLIDEAQLIVPSSSSSIEAQKLRLIDDNSQYSALDRRSIKYHRSSATEQQDSITNFIGQRSLQPTAVHVQRWQADSLEQDEGAGSVLSKHQHSDNVDNVSLGLEQAWHFSPAWIQDLKGEDGATKSSNSQLEKFNTQLSQFYEGESKKFKARSTVRDTQVGYWFEFNDHPEIDGHSGADKEFLITGKHFYNQNNLPKDLNDQIQKLLQQSNWTVNTTQNNSEERQANHLILQRRNIATVPEYNPLEHRPAAHPQRARVVGPSGESIYVDEWGRIKVRFLFTRQEDHGHDGGAGSNENDTDSAWVDVLTPWAGDGYGARFLPRIDEIVVIDFFDGNIDRPFVVGRLHEAQRSPTKFDVKGQLPDTKKLSGIRSKEVGGGGFNQLRFDDTTGQISAQLQSSHGASQLNLGNLSHPKESDKSEGRGEGFELRTDQWGAVRAGQGLLVSTYKQDQAKGEHLDAEIAKKQLEGSQTNSKALSDIAKQQQTDEIESVEQLKAFAEQIQQKIAKFEKALLLLSSPDGIGLSTSEDIHISADAQINQIAGDSINISTQKNLIAHAQNRLSLFAAQGGLKAVAAKNKVEIQAQSDALDVLAKMGITISSTDDKVIISSPKEVQITGASSQITLNGSGIFPKTGGKFEVKAGQHIFQGGSKVQPKNIGLPLLGETQNWMELNYHYDDLSPVKGAPFKVFFEDGSYREGVLDDKGYAKLENVPKGKSEIFYGEDPAEFKRDIPDDLDAETQEEDENDDNLWSLLDEEAYQKLTNDLQNGAK
ncbi:type VI secretion system Vgr family protein [Acinetobacter lanii]|uniref:Type VI secretion system tip protein VgrG n=1 Tax=Acinetobacter lanii TaxID=2715163 RepID=A0A6G8S842_9GAMM|nr:type VI secretion system Vgr family protein [Acinetobacter lanii]QIO10365.1 type VI secretion system tip protein VgrG [Acinetobacter lanii]